MAFALVFQLGLAVLVIASAPAINVKTMFVYYPTVHLVEEIAQSAPMGIVQKIVKYVGRALGQPALRIPSVLETHV